MCGIAGIATWNCRPDLVQRVERMALKLQRRGPDDSGAWADTEHGIALGHRRLSVIDLSPTGHQPMVSASGRYVVAYNGEIYNFERLRTELKDGGLAPAWRGHSDTEVLLAAVEAWGLEPALRKAGGMFAFALWDRETRTMTLARDRIGEKPLYYGCIDGEWLFASELGAIRAGALGDLSIDRDALAQFMRFGCVPGPQTIYRGIFKLQPGHLVRVVGPTAAAAPLRYWSADGREHERLRAQLAEFDDDALIDTTHDLLREAVGLQMISDVSLGAFLSGGVDSSTVVALMQTQSSRPVRSFTIGFEEGAFDESPYARAVAKHLGTDHTELFVSAMDAADLIPDLPSVYDEPFADSSQIPTTLVSRLTRQHVTVALSGDGGDELFGGYPRYPITQALWQRINGHPLGARRALSRALAYPSAHAWDRFLAMVPGARGRNINGRRVHRLSQLLTTEGLGEMYVRLMSRWQPEDGLVLGADPQFVLPGEWRASHSPIEAMRRWDIGQYLPDDLLVKVDRAAMSASLETRAPLLDHRVVELALAMPEHALIRDGVGKWVLRRVLDRYVPRHLIDRPKAGFEVPLAQWLRGPLRDWAESLLDPVRLSAEGLLDASKVTRLWQQHLAASFDRSQFLWNVLMFQAWLRATPEMLPVTDARPVALAS